MSWHFLPAVRHDSNGTILEEINFFSDDKNTQSLKEKPRFSSRDSNQRASNDSGQSGASNEENEENEDSANPKKPRNSFVSREYSVDSFGFKQNKSHKKIGICSKIVRLTGFYIAFYGFLGVFLSLLYAGVVIHSKNYENLELSIIKKRPGLSFFPLPPSSNFKTFTVWYNRSLPEQTKLYTTALLDIINQEYPTVQNGFKYVRCNYDLPYAQGAYYKNLTAHKKACRVYDPEFLDWGPCTPNNITKDGNGPFILEPDAFGFDSGRPCIMLRLNKIQYWIPSSDWLSASKKKEYASVGDELGVDDEDEIINFPNFKSYIWINCKGLMDEDKELVGNIIFYPRQRPGIPKVYFPFTNQIGYLPPFIFLHFENPTPHVVIRIECIAYDNQLNLGPYGDRRMAVLNFELLVD